MSVLEQQFPGSLTPPALTTCSRNKGTQRAEVMWEGLWRSLLWGDQRGAGGKGILPILCRDLRALAGRTRAEGRWGMVCL